MSIQKVKEKIVKQAIVDLAKEMLAPVREQAGARIRKYDAWYHL